MFTKEQVKHYYNSTLFGYWLYHRSSNGLHYGIWDDTIHSIPQAITNTNRYLAQVGGITSTDKVLDAGCGIGGSSLWLAKNIGCQVLGISIANKQIVKARELAKKENLDSLVTFETADYTQTSYPDNSFDVVWAIESVCYALDKKVFLSEANRVLKKGGRLILSDGFLYRQPTGRFELMLYSWFTTGFVLDWVPTFEQFKKDMKAVGFRKIRMENLTPKVMKTARRLFWYGLLSYPWAKLLSTLRIIEASGPDNTLTMIAQYLLLKRHLGGYGLFYAEK